MLQEPNKDEQLTHEALLAFVILGTTGDNQKDKELKSLMKEHWHTKFIIGDQEISLKDLYEDSKKGN